MGFLFLGCLCCCFKAGITYELPLEIHLSSWWSRSWVILVKYLKPAVLTLSFMFYGFFIQGPTMLKFPLGETLDIPLYLMAWHFYTFFFVYPWNNWVLWLTNHTVDVNIHSSSLSYFIYLFIYFQLCIEETSSS